MNRIILFLLILVIPTVGLAQQPFKKYGVEVPIATMSKGKFEEFFDQDTLVQIGSVILHRLTGKIHAFVEYDTLYSEATLDPEIISRFLSPDPHAENYYSLSPYNYVANNPILFIDPDGRDIHLSFASAEAREAYMKVVNMGLEGQYTAQLSAVEGQDGVFSLSFEATKNGSFDNLSEQGRAFFTEMSNVINDHDHIAKMKAVYADETVLTGQYMTGKIDMADVQQYNVTGVTVEETVGATQIGKVVHETVEQHQKAKMGVRHGSMKGFNSAHDRAIQAENAVNQNTRGRQYGSIKDFTVPYTDKNGKVVHVRTRTTRLFGGRLKVIQVTQPKPKAKKRGG